MLVSAIVLSNTLVYTNQVEGVILTSTWSDGPKVIGQEYAFSVNYVSPSGTPNTALVVEFDCIGIVPGNITLLYYTGASWTPTSFTQGTNAITGTTMTIAGGTSGGYDFKLTYNGLGIYTMKVWAG